MSTTHFVTATGEVPCGKVNYREDFTSAQGDAVPVNCPDCIQLVFTGAPDPDSAAPAIEPTNAELLAEVKELRTQLGAVVEFVNVLKGMGESLANAKGMQATMLRNMVPGLELLGGQ